MALSWMACASGQSSPMPPPPAVASAPAAPAPQAPLSGLHFDIRAIDPRADPCSDFYDYACGGWRATHPIPPDQTRWDRYAEMAAVNLERERTIVEEAARGDSNASAAEQRVGSFYAACMDESGIEARGLSPVRESLRAIDAIKTRRDVLAVLTDLHAHDVEALFSAYVETDPGDAAQTVLWLDKGPLGLPDPADYTKTDDRSVKLRERYVAHLFRLFQRMGRSDADAKRACERVLAFETPLARRALSVVERRNRELQHHPMTVAELNARFPAIDWRSYLTRLGAPSVERVNVAQPAWLEAVNAALSSKDLAGARDYLTMLVVRAQAMMLPKAIEEEVFDFRQRTLRGAREMAPRWKRCLRSVDANIGDDVGRIFVARYFSDEARARVMAMVETLIASYRADIASCDWLEAPARETALQKLSSMIVVLGASNRPRAFDGLRIDRDDPFGNAWRAGAFYVVHRLAKIGKPTDRESFFEPLPQELDGFGSNTKVATGFTAGFLQPPVFDVRLDDAVNHGALGSVIGHELSHLFDDEGRKYDAGGNLRPWWSPQDIARFQERAQCFVEEYSGFRTDDGTPLDGRLTLGENIADNGGIRLSYAALHPSDSGPKIDGFTPSQRFFLAWGQIRCENVTPERARRQAQTDPHSAGRWRVNGVVSNVPEFARAFSCPAGAPMAPTKRCSVW